jgi:hypothetical protein
MKRLKKILIVDGYNVINAWEDLKKLSEENLEYAREKLNYVISEYAQFKGYKTIIVYDAYKVKDSVTRYEKIKNLEIVFTKEKETADTYIERYITELGPKKFLDITVATDDIAEQQVVSGKGGNRISTRQLYIEVNNAQVKIQEKIQKTVKNKRNTLDDFLDKEMMEKLNDMRKKDL